MPRTFLGETPASIAALALLAAGGCWLLQKTAAPNCRMTELPKRTTAPAGAAPERADAVRKP